MSNGEPQGGPPPDSTMIAGEALGPSTMELPPGMKITITFSTGPLKGQKVSVSKALFTVGRKEGADLVIQDQTVSSAHAIFEVSRDKVVTLKDRQSTNGTFVGNKRIEEAELKNMDEIGFGESKALITIIQDSFGLYQDDFLGGEEAGQTSGILTPSVEPYTNLLVAGYNSGQFGALRDVAHTKNISKITTACLNGAELIYEAARAFRAQKPVDLILTEVKMPIINGLNAALSFRNMERAYEIKNAAPIMFFTESPADDTMKKIVKYLNPSKHMQSTSDLKEFKRRSEIILERMADFRKRGK